MSINSDAMKIRSWDYAKELATGLGLHLVATSEELIVARGTDPTKTTDLSGGSKWVVYRGDTIDGVVIMLEGLKRFSQQPDLTIR